MKKYCEDLKARAMGYIRESSGSRYTPAFGYGPSSIVLDCHEILYLIDELERLETLTEKVSKENVQRGMVLVYKESEIIGLRKGMQALLDRPPVSSYTPPGLS